MYSWQKCAFYILVACFSMLTSSNSTTVLGLLSCRPLGHLRFWFRPFGCRSFVWLMCFLAVFRTFSFLLVRKKGQRQTRLEKKTLGDMIPLSAFAWSLFSCQKQNITKETCSIHILHMNKLLYWIVCWHCNKVCIGRWPFYQSMTNTDYFETFKS